MNSRETATRLQGELTEARCDLAGARAVIAEQARTERELQAQAGVLAASLEAAREDVHGLMAKVGAWRNDTGVSMMGVFEPRL